MSNSEYLLSPEWSKIRNWIFERSGGLCEYCWQEKSDQVHHRINQRQWSTYEEPDTRDLMALCSPCHEFVHEEGRQPSFHPLSPLGMGVSGFAQKGEHPGSWYVFRQSHFRWFGWHPDPRIGLYSYTPADQPSKVFEKNNEIVKIYLVGKGKERGKTVERYWSYLMESSKLPNLSKWMQFSEDKDLYKNHCHGCKKNVTSDEDPKCRECGWLVCGTCLSCGCNYDGLVHKFFLS
jgi:hypothetical protein